MPMTLLVFFRRNRELAVVRRGWRTALGFQLLISRQLLMRVLLFLWSSRGDWMLLVVCSINYSNCLLVWICFHNSVRNSMATHCLRFFTMHFLRLTLLDIFFFDRFFIFLSYRVHAFRVWWWWFIKYGRVKRLMYRPGFSRLASINMVVICWINYRKTRVNCLSV